MKILIVEDNTINQNLFLRLFRKLGYEPDIVSDGGDAISITHKQSYDLIFMDIMLPYTDGIRATKAIRSLTLEKQPVIIAITAFAEPEEKQACFSAGMNDYLTKPFTAEQLQATIQKWSSV